MAEPGVDPQALPSLDGLSFEDIVRAVEGIHTRITPPARSPDDSMRLVNRRFAPMSNETVAGIPSRDLVPAQPTRGERAMNALMDYGPLPAKMATNVLLQPVHAGEAVGEALNDPSIPNVTNAGMQTAMALFQPAKALKILGAGYGAAALKDAGANPADWVNPSPAFAAPKKKSAAPEVPDLPGLTPEQNSEYKQARQRIDAGEFDSGAARRSLEDTRRRLEGLSDEFVKGNADLERQAKARKQQSDQAEYDAAVARAEAAKNAELAKGGRRFNETAIGQLYDKTGIMTPGLLAAGVGGMSRAATGGGTFAKDYGIPIALGAGTGITAANYPKAHDVIFAPAANPEKAAYNALARELPPTHPRKAEWQAYADRQPDDNPVMTQASKEFYDPAKLIERSGLGLIEGVVGGPLGADAVRILGKAPAAMGSGVRSSGGLVGDAVEGAGTLGGRFKTGQNRAMGEAYSAEATAAEAAADAASARVLRDQALETEQQAALALNGNRGQVAAPPDAPSQPQGGQSPQSATSPNQVTSINPPSTGSIIAPATGGNQALDLRGFGQELGRALAEAHVRGAQEFGDAVRSVGTAVRELAEAGKISQGEFAALREDLTRQIEAIKSQPPRGGNFPPPRNAPGPGPYIEGGSQPYARAVIDDMIKRGDPLGPKQGAEVMRRINAAVPPGVTPTKAADVRARLSNTIDEIGPRPTAQQWDDLKARVPEGTDTLGNKKMFALPFAVGGASGMNALFADSADAAPSPRNALLSDPSLGPGPRLAPAEPYHHSHDQPRRRDGTFK